MATVVTADTRRRLPPAAPLPGGSGPLNYRVATSPSIRVFDPRHPGGESVRPHGCSVIALVLADLRSYGLLLGGTCDAVVPVPRRRLFWVVPRSKQ